MSTFKCLFEGSEVPSTEIQFIKDTNVHNADNYITAYVLFDETIAEINDGNFKEAYIPIHFSKNDISFNITGRQINVFSKGSTTENKMEIYELEVNDLKACGTVFYDLNTKKPANWNSGRIGDFILENGQPNLPIAKKDILDSQDTNCSSSRPICNRG